MIGYDSSKTETYEYDYGDSSSYILNSRERLFMRYFKVENPEVVTAVRIYLPEADSSVEVDIIPDYNDRNSYTFSSNGSLTAEYPGWYTIDLINPVVLDPEKVSGDNWFGVVVKTSNAMSYDDTSQINTAYRYETGSDNSWHYASDSSNPSRGWRIKAITSKDEDYVNICRAYYELGQGSNLWNLIKGSNTDYQHLRSNLTTPGSGPYGTTFTYSSSNTSLISSTGKVSRPACSTSYFGAVNITATFTRGTSSFYYTLQFTVDPTHTTLTKHAATAATLEKEGNTEYWECTRCGRYFSDSNAMNEIAKNSWVISKLTPQNGWVLVNGTWYYYKNNVLATGWLKYNNQWYYLEPSTGAMQTGFVAVGSAIYYMNSSGAMLTGWFMTSGDWYYASSSGALASGWLKLGNTWYYLDPTSYRMRTGFVTVGDYVYYMNSSGAMLIGWFKDNGNWYYAMSSGVVCGSWLKVNGTWYYLDPSTGAMQTGLKTINGLMYYLESSGAMAANCWRQVGGYWYYFGSSGAALKNGTYTIGGKKYKFDKDGKWIA